MNGEEVGLFDTRRRKVNEENEVNNHAKLERAERTTVSGLHVI